MYVARYRGGASRSNRRLEFAGGHVWIALRLDLESGKEPRVGQQIVRGNRVVVTDVSRVDEDVRGVNWQPIGAGDALFGPACALIMGKGAGAVSDGVIGIVAAIIVADADVSILVDGDSRKELIAAGTLKVRGCRAHGVGRAE